MDELNKLLKEDELRAKLAARAALGPYGLAGDYAALALTQGQDPAGAIRSRIVGNRVDAYRVSTPETPQAYQPSAALKARIASMDPALQPAARKLAAQGWDATAALEQAFAEGQRLERLEASGDLGPGDLLTLAYHKANVLRARHGLPRLEQPAVNFTANPKPLTPEQAETVATVARRLQAIGNL